MVDALISRDGLDRNSPRYASGYMQPPYRRFLQDDSGSAIDLTGTLASAFTLTMVNVSNPLLVKTGGGTFSIVNAIDGEISYAYAIEDLADAGNWYLFLTVRLVGESSPRVFDPELLEIYVFPGGDVFVTTQDVNITEVGGAGISTSNPVPISGPVSIADGANIALGTTTDSSSASTTIGLLKAIKAYLAGTLTTTTSGTITEANSAAMKTDLDSLVTSTGAVSDAAYSGSGNGTEIAILKKLVAQLAATLNVSATQSGTWNITNVSGTVSLPTGASTSAKQPALGTAGTPSSDVLTIQGASSMTPVAQNLSQVNGTTHSANNPAFVLAEGSPDSGVTYKPLKTTSDGTTVANATLQAGNALAGGLMTYREMVTRALAGTVKVLTGTQALVNNGGSAAAAISFTDQAGNSYSTVTSGKTLYIAYIDATLDLGGTTTAPLTQASTVTISDGSNNKYKFVATSGGPGRELSLLPTISSGLTLTVKASPSNLGTAVGNVVVTLLCWEE